MQLWNTVQLYAPAEFVPQKSHRMIKTGGGSLNLDLITENREKHFGMTIIGRNFNISQGHHTDSRILDLKPDQVRELAPNLLGHAQRAGEIAGHDFAVKNEPERLP